MITILITIWLILIYLYTTRNHNYWKARNVKHDSPVPLFGNHFYNVLSIKSLTVITSELYDKYQNEKVVGYFTGVTPELIIKDPEIIKDVLTVHFDHFYPRMSVGDTEKDPLIKNLLFAQGDTWKLLRRSLTPAFTTAKLKAMFPLAISCIDKLRNLGQKIVDNGGEYDVGDLMTRFTSEFICSFGFGINVDVIRNENSFFKQLGKNVFKHMAYRFYFYDLLVILPDLRQYLQLFNKNIEKILTDEFEKILKGRNYKPSGRNDLIDLLIKLTEKGSITGKSMEHKNSDGSPKEAEIKMDMNCAVSQIFSFLAAGFETSATAISNTLHELAFHPELQGKIHDEIDYVLSKYDNTFCYDAVTEMSLLNMTFKESLRLHPPVGTLHRICAKRYTFPQLDLTIDPGVKIIIPIQAIQTDERYFEKSYEFRPERFQDEGIKMNKYAYMPFGAGPRACIGARFAQMQSLIGLSAILQKFKVEPSEKTPRKLKICNRLNIVQRAQSGVPLRLKLRDK